MNKREKAQVAPMDIYIDELIERQRRKRGDLARVSVYDTSYGGYHNKIHTIIHKEKMKYGQTCFLTIYQGWRNRREWWYIILSNENANALLRGERVHQAGGTYKLLQ